MQFVYEIGGEHEEKLIRIQQALVEDNSLESLVLSCLEEHLKTTMIVDEAAKGGPVLVITLENARPEEHIGIVTLPESQWKKWGEFEPLNTTIYQYADQEGSLPNVEWFKDRNARLRLKLDQVTGVMTAPPGSLRELIVSYLLSERGMICIERQIVELSTSTTFAAMLHLRSMPEQQEATFAEDIAVSIEKLRTMVERRKTLNRLKRLVLAQLYQ